MTWLTALLDALFGAITSALSRSPPTPEPPSPPPPDPAPGFAAIRDAEDARLARESTAPVTLPRQATASAVDRAEDAGAMLSAPMVATDVLGDDEPPTARRPQ